MAPGTKPPEEQRRFPDRGAASIEGPTHRPDRETGAPSADPGDAEVNPGQQMHYGNLKQNLTIHWQVQER